MNVPTRVDGQAAPPRCFPWWPDAFPEPPRAAAELIRDAEAGEAWRDLRARRAALTPEVRKSMEAVLEVITASLTFAAGVADLTEWLEPLNVASSNPVPPDQLARRADAIIEVLGAVPMMALSAESRRLVHSDYCPTHNDVRKVVETVTRPWLRRAVVLRMLLAFPVAPPQQEPPARLVHEVAQRLQRVPTLPGEEIRSSRGGTYSKPEAMGRVAPPPEPRRQRALPEPIPEVRAQILAFAARVPHG